MAKSLTIEQVKARLKLGENFMKPFVEIDVGNSRRWLDPSVVPAFLAMDDDTEIGIVDYNVQNDVPISPSNILTTAILAKMAAISVNRPDWHVVCQDEQGNNDPDSAELVRQDMRIQWDHKNWQRIAQRALLKRSVGGLGTVAWSWGGPGDGSVFEHVFPLDLRMEPFVIDWQNPAYAGRRIRISLHEAAERYPKASFDKTIGKSQDMGDKTKVAIEIYWDRREERHVYQQEELVHINVSANKDAKANLYGRVPLLFLEGDLHPGNMPFPVGDGTLAAGAAAEHQDITQSVSNTAKAGQGMWVVDSSLDKSVRDTIKSPKDNMVIEYQGADKADGRIFRVPGEELRPAVLEGRREARDSVMALVGVSQMDLGQLMENPSFATEVAAVANKGGSRQNQARAEFETFLNRWANIHVSLVKNFGGPQLSGGVQLATTEQLILHEAYSKVVEIKVVESSTTYKDPGIEQQQSLQLYQQVAQSYPLWLSLAQTGVVKRIPSLEKVTDRMYRAWGISNTDQYWQDAPQLPQQGQEQGKSPMEMISYKDAPEDIKRQMEVQAGMQPSQMGGNPDDQGAGIEAMKQHGENQRLHAKLSDEGMARLHDAAMQYQKFNHEQALKQADLAGRAQIARMQAQKSKSNGSSKK